MNTIKIPFEFLPIPGYEGFFEINPLGTVRGVKRTIITKNGKKLEIPKRYMKTRLSNSEYREVQLTRNGITKQFFVHILVAKVFLRNPQKKCCVNHLSGDKEFNAYFSLEFVTHKENMVHAYQCGLVRKQLKSVVDISNKKVFPSIAEAAKAYNIPYKTLLKYLNGERSNPTTLRRNTAA